MQIARADLTCSLALSGLKAALEPDVHQWSSMGAVSHCSVARYLPNHYFDLFAVARNAACVLDALSNVLCILFMYMGATSN